MCLNRWKSAVPQTNGDAGLGTMAGISPIPGEVTGIAWIIAALTKQLLTGMILQVDD